MKSRIRSAATLILLMAATVHSGLSASQEEQASIVNIRTATVHELKTAGNYAYLLVLEDGEETWLATLPQFVAHINEGDVVEYVAEVEMHDFTSKALNRTFDVLWFVSQIRQKNIDAPKQDAGQLPADHP